MDSKPGVIGPAIQQEIIRSLIEKLRACYVFPDVAEEICACLQAHLEAGDYADLTEGEFFAFALTTHMQEVNHDEHLWVKWHPEPLPDEAEALHQNPEWQAQRQLEARLDNFGLHKAERLPGNIGYLDIRYFHRAAWSGETISAAMNFLANTSALIIDLRNCTGGYPATIALVSSYLFGNEPIHLSSIYWRDDDRTQQYWTLPHVPGQRFGVEKPIYALISRTTFSAGEEFAAILQTRRRATLLGDKTDGGAHPGASYRLHPHFEAFIPLGRAFNPLTGQDLEGQGVSPDLSVPQEHACIAAYHLALQAVQASLGTAPNETLQAFAREIQTALRELETNQKICPQCGYQNPLYATKCKNCDEPLGG
jgi:retinol-binding protein 3